MEVGMRFQIERGNSFSVRHLLHHRRIDVTTHRFTTKRARIRLLVYFDINLNVMLALFSSRYNFVSIR